MFLFLVPGFDVLTLEGSNNEKLGWDGCHGTRRG